MENSNQQIQILNLGKLLVKELGLEPGSDTLSRWIAHYIAEKITLLEQLPRGEDRENIEKECFEMILKLWHHRQVLPSGKRPLQEFEPIFDVLNRINPENDRPFFYIERENEPFGSEKNYQDLKDVKECLTMIPQIDKVARIWIDSIIHIAAAQVKNEKTEQYLKSFIEESGSIEIKIINAVLDIDFADSLENRRDNQAEKKISNSKIQRRIAELEAFSKLNEFLLEHYKKNLQELN